MNLLAALRKKHNLGFSSHCGGRYSGWQRCLLAILGDALTNKDDNYVGPQTPWSKLNERQPEDQLRCAF